MLQLQHPKTEAGEKNGEERKKPKPRRTRTRSGGPMQLNKTIKKIKKMC